MSTSFQDNNIEIAPQHKVTIKIKTWKKKFKTQNEPQPKPIKTKTCNIITKEVIEK